MTRRWRIGLPVLVLLLGLVEVAWGRRVSGQAASVRALAGKPQRAPWRGRAIGSKWRNATQGGRRRNLLGRRQRQAAIGRPKGMRPLAGSQMAPALAPIHMLRPDVPPAQLVAGFERYRSIIGRVRAASRSNPGGLRVTRAGRASGLSILRVDLIGDQPVAGRRPRVLVVGGMHAGNETVGEETATRFIEAASRDPALRNQFDITVVPLLNPTGLVLGERENAGGTDVNRSFAPGKWTAESAVIRDIAEGEHFDLVIDLHGAGSRGRNGFFLIHPGDDRGMSGRILSPLESSALMDSPTGSVGPYTLDHLGSSVSSNQGTLTGFFAARGTRHSYTVEAPLKLDPERQVRGMVKLLRSSLFNVRRHGG